MLVQSHTAVLRPASSVRVVDRVLVVRVRVDTEVSLDEVSRLVGGEAEQDVNPVDVSRVEPDWVSGLGRLVTVLQEAITHLSVNFTLKNKGRVKWGGVGWGKVAEGKLAGVKMAGRVIEE